VLLAFNKMSKQKNFVSKMDVINAQLNVGKLTAEYNRIAKEDLSVHPEKHKLLEIFSDEVMLQRKIVKQFLDELSND
jgi:hypothetical protein